MKAILFLLILAVCACASDNNSEFALQIDRLEAKVKEDSITRSFIKNYIRDINDNDWPNKIGPYLPNLEFIEQHKVFRSAFQNFNFKIKHLTVDGNEGMLWGIVSAQHVNDISDSNLGLIPATHDEVRWEEVWYNTVDGNKFGEAFELMHNDLQRMNTLV